MTLTTTKKRSTGPLERRQQLIEQALGKCLPAATQPPQVVHEGMRYCVFSGGKRFRPLLCLAAAGAAGSAGREALTTACAIELIHTYSLVHDDLPAMDNADERRGLPTAHRKFGEGNAILIGDALLTFAFELLSRNRGKNGLAVLDVVAHACGSSGLIGGQVLDLQVISRPTSSTEESLKEIARQKTGALIAASVLAGGLCGGATTRQLKSLSRYGQNLGLAFQMIDDVHDREGLSQILGLDEAARQAQNLIARAEAALEPFGRRSAGLRQMAQRLAATLPNH